MHTDDLPQEVQSELALILRMLFEEFDKSLSMATQPWKKAGRILKVMLCTGHSPSFLEGYSVPRPRYDLLVALNDERFTKFPAYSAIVEDRLFRESTILGTIRSDVALMVYSLAEVNGHLRRGTPFFVDLLRNAIALYDYDGGGFAPPVPLADSQIRLLSQRYFRFWYPLSINARKLALSSRNNGVSRDAAFLLHQAVERVYHCLLFTLTLHSPKTHRLELLRAASERVAPSLATVWPTQSKFERKCFEKLRLAYGQARYSENYRISEAELSWIDERVSLLQTVARIEKAIQDLPGLVREIFKARRSECLEYEEIAARFQISLADVELMMENALDAVATA